MEEVTSVSRVRAATPNLWRGSGSWAERRPVLVYGFRRFR